jgi:hypothetical protein
MDEEEYKVDYARHAWFLGEENARRIWTLEKTVALHLGGPCAHVPAGECVKNGDPEK